MFEECHALAHVGDPNKAGNQLAPQARVAKLHTDQTFLLDECQSSHGVRGHLDLHLSLPIPSGFGVIGGVGSLLTGRSSGRNTPA